MNPNSNNSISQSSPGTGSSFDRSGTGEDTLWLIAALPSPEGLETRVHAALRTAPRRGRILAWPLRAEAAWVRATAAAAIVMVVAGGGWGIYSRIQPLQAAKPPVPARVGGAGGFSNADAKRSPQTLQLPVVSATPKTAVTTQPKKKIHKKAAAPGVQAPQATPASK
jgi:hypothetical protein